MKPFALEKSEEYFRDEAPPSQGRTWEGAILLSGGAILPGILPSGRGKLKPSTSPTILSSWEDQSSSMITHKYRGSIVAFLINKSVEPNEELKVELIFPSSSIDH
jgi:hypothetical protein